MAIVLWGVSPPAHFLKTRVRRNRQTAPSTAIKSTDWQKPQSHQVKHSLKKRGQTIEKYSKQHTSGPLLPPAEIIKLLALTMTADSVTQWLPPLLLLPFVLSLSLSYHDYGGVGGRGVHYLSICMCAHGRVCLKEVEKNWDSATA